MHFSPETRLSEFLRHTRSTLSLHTAWILAEGLMKREYTFKEHFYLPKFEQQQYRYLRL